MSYEAWRREVALGLMPEYDEEADRRATLIQRRACCVDRMVNNPPTEPHQHCQCGSPLPWYDPDDPERGFFDCHQEREDTDE